MGRSIRGLLAGAALSACSLVASSAQASVSCIREPERKLENAPRNVVLRIEPIEGWDYTLRLKKAVVPVARKVLRQDFGEVHELRPKVALAPNTTYQLVRSKMGEPDVVERELTTGAGSDTKAPTFEGIENVRLMPQKDKPDRATPRSPYIELDLKPASDDQLEEEDLRFAVWEGKPSGEPVVIAKTQGRRLLRLGGKLVCSPYWVPMPDLARIHLWVAAVDLAGNMSPRREVEFGVAPETGEKR
ncbi:MAG: hypothetical protein QM765_45040 [Myxococcales bacterium]